MNKEELMESARNTKKAAYALILNFQLEQPYYLKMEMLLME